MRGLRFSLLYINDVPKCTDGADTTLFADDTQWFIISKLTLSTENKFSSFITLRQSK